MLEVTFKAAALPLLTEIYHRLHDYAQRSRFLDSVSRQPAEILESLRESLPNESWGPSSELAWLEDALGLSKAVHTPVSASVPVSAPAPAPAPVRRRRKSSSSRRDIR